MKRLILIASGVLVIGVVVYRGDYRTSKPQARTPKAKPVPSTSKKDISQTVNHKPVVIGIHETVYKALDIHSSSIQRRKNILALRRISLSPADERALVNHLLTPQEREAFAAKNDIIEHLVRFGKDQKQVGDMILKILNNEHQHQVIREYTLQYTPEYYLTRWSAGSTWSELSEADRLKFNETMWAMSDLRVGSMAGGALFALFKIADQHADVDKEEVYEKANEVLIDSSYASPNRMGAVQILAFSENEKYYEAAREVVLQRKGPALLQVTAMNTAAKSNEYSEEFYQYLHKVSSGEITASASVKKCAQLTLKKLSNN